MKKKPTFLDYFSKENMKKVMEYYYPNYDEVEKWVNKYKKGLNKTNVKLQEAIETEAMYNILMVINGCIDIPSYRKVEKEYGLPRNILTRYHKKFVKEIEEVKNGVKDNIRKVLDMNDIVKALDKDTSQEYSKFVRTYILGDDNLDKPDTIIQIGKVNISLSPKKRKEALEKADEIIDAKAIDVKDMPKKTILTSDFLQLQAVKVKELLRQKEKELEEASE